MKIKIQARVSVLVEKTVIANSLEDALAQAQSYELGDFLLHRADTQSWLESRKVKIVGATEPIVTVAR